MLTSTLADPAACALDTQSIAVELVTTARTALAAAPYRQYIVPPRKLDPSTVTTLPPSTGPALGTSSVTTGMVAYSNSTMLFASDAWSAGPTICTCTIPSLLGGDTDDEQTTGAV